jgi:hypothetical protein
MKQLTLAMAGFERYAKTTRRAVFLAEMWETLDHIRDGEVRNILLQTQG